MSSTTPKNFSPNTKDIRYLNKDFTQLRQSLINFAKTYYPNTFQDFSPASPGMMFIEQAAYVGDVLSYYTDYAFKEGVMASASERRNIVNLAGYLGYKVKPSRAASGVIDIYQICPSATDGNGKYFPDPNYMLMIKENAQFSNKSLVYYVLNQSVDFTISTAQNQRIDTVYSRKADGTPEFFLLKKQGNITAGQILRKQQVVGNAQAFYQINLDEENILGVVDVVDSDNNIWYEVDYMAQEVVPIAVPNDIEFEGSLNQYKDSVPYILNFLKTSRRFITMVDQNNKTTLQFGAGVNGADDEIVTFDSNLIGIGLSNARTVNIPLDPSNFLNNENYGIAPFNTTLTVRYLVGGGLNSNAQTGDITDIVSMDFANSIEGLLPEQSILLNTVKNSIQVTNPSPCVGGKDGETNDEIKMNSVANFAAQSRAITQDDFLVRIYSLPAKFGSVAKAQVIADTSLSVGVNKMLLGVVDNNNIGQVIDNNNNNYFRQLAYDVTNPFAINVYLLSYNESKQLTKPNAALITNIITYLKQFRMMTDGINVIDGYIINIGVDFTITVYKGFNKKDVLSNCIATVQDFFNIEKWNFSQPINLSQLQLQIAKVDGVQSIVNIDIVNKTVLDGLYSPIAYDISAATKNGIIYNSTDPAIFEVKYPNRDINGSTR